MFVIKFYRYTPFHCALFYCALYIFLAFLFFKLKVCSKPDSNKSNITIFPITYAYYFMSTNSHNISSLFKKNTFVAVICDD